MKKVLQSMMPAYGWMLFTTFLLLLPGSAFPKETWLSKIYFDKIAHLLFFAVMTWLFCHGYYAKGKSRAALKQIFLNIAIAAFLYGLSIEFVQKYLVPNRSFDPGDIVADAAGATLGYAFSFFMYLRRNSRN